MSRLRTPAAQELAELAARVGEGQRLSRGRRYQRQGNVLDLDVSDELITATVAGSRAEPYHVSIACKPANENERRAAMDDPSGAIPRAIDVAYTCICPDWGDPCKHGIAVMLEFAEEVDGDAHLLLAWRGIHDVVVPPPPGTESLTGASGDTSLTAGPDADAPPDTSLTEEASADASRPDVSPAQTPAGRSSVRDIRSRLDDVLTDPDDLLPPSPSAAARTAAADMHESSALSEFFEGAMPDEVESLVGPLDETQLDIYQHVRIPLERVDAAPVFADAIDAIADFWLDR